MVGVEPPEKITGNGGPGTLVEGSLALMLGRAADLFFVERTRRDGHRTLENMKRLLEEMATLAILVRPGA